MAYNYELIEKWVERLRNPRSKQAHHTLKEGNSYCCLGHACVVAKPNYRFKFDWNNSIIKFGKYLNTSNFLPEEIMKQYGFKSNNPYFDIPSKHRKLALDIDDDGNGKRMKASDLNDSKNFTLNDIADCIEYTMQKSKQKKARKRKKELA